MKFLADQDVYAVTVRLLRSQGHDVVTASELGLERSSDAALLQSANSSRRILLTRDRDFGSLVFANAMSGGVIYLRILPTTLLATHDELIRVLERYTEDELLNALVVVEPGRHRMRKIAG